MNFLAPLFLLGTLAVTLPIIFHLIRRTTRERRVFSSLMFLLPSPPRLSRRSRLEHLALLVLRCVVVCLLALAFARPFFRHAAVGGSPPDVARRWAVLVDASASMRRAGLWAEARRQAETVLRRTAPADEAALFTFDRELHPLVSLEEWNRAPVAERVALATGKLATASPGWLATHTGRALIAAAETLAEPTSGLGKRDGRPTAGPGRLVLISDLQEGSRLEPLQGYEWPKNVAVSIVLVKPKPGNNAALQLVTEPDDAAPSSAASVRVRVSNAADSRRDQFKVGWAQADGRTLAGTPADVYVPPGQSRIVPLPLPLAAEPASRLPADAGAARIILQGDDEDFDNSVFVVPPETERLSVVYWGREAEKDPAQPLYFLRRAFQETRRQAVEVIAGRPGAPDARTEPNPRGASGTAARAGAGEISAADLARASLLVLTEGLPASMAAAVHGQVAAGKTLLVALRAGANAATLAGLLGLPRLGLEEASVKTYAILGEIDFRHPLFAPFANPRFSDFAKIHFWKYRRLEAGTIPGARVLAKFDNGDPALVEVPVGKGRLLVLTSCWHPEDSQLALSTKFVPLLYALLEYSGAQGPLPTQYHVGDSIPLAAASPPDSSARVMRTPDGLSVALAPGEASFSRTLAPGIYTLTSSQPPRRWAVNLDAAESRTAPLAVEELERLGVPLARPEEPGAREAERRTRLLDAEWESRQRLWRWCLVGALLVLLGETWLAGKTGRGPGGRESGGVEAVKG